MQIYLATGVGEGPTALAAFDAALLNAGVANHNLIYLSSVIPPAGVIHRARYVAAPDAYGDRLYVVMARHIEEEPGKCVWAGLGWTQDTASGRCLFVEVHGSQHQKVAQEIQATLTTMLANRSLYYGSIEMEITGIECRHQPVCAVAVAVYQNEHWQKEVIAKDRGADRPEDRSEDRRVGMRHRHPKESYYAG